MVREQLPPLRDRCFPLAESRDIDRIDSEAQFRRMSLLWMAGITLSLVPVATLVDVPIARWFRADPLPPIVRSGLEATANYGDALGVLMVIAAVAIFSRRRRWSVPRLATLAGGGGAVATLAKMFVLRPRPNALPIESSTYDYAWIWSFDWTLSKVVNFDPSTRAFPSASVATAAALTVGLWVITPRFRYVGLGLCVATMLQRLACGAHFISDLFGSTVIGLTWAFTCFHPRLMGTIFDRMEYDARRKPASKGRTATLESADDPVPSSTGVDSGRDDSDQADSDQIAA